MTQYTWTTCPDIIKTQIATFQTHLQSLLGNNLVGLYLHGSLATGCFNPNRSDIDLLVVTTRGMSVQTKRDIGELLLRSSAAPAPFEISFLVEPDIHPFRHPLPYDLHYSETWREQYRQQLADGEWRHWNDTSQQDYDLAAHLTITLQRGMCLYGKAIENTFPSVPPQYYVASIMGDFEDARDSRAAVPVYFVLNACRVYAYLLIGGIFSKDEGGQWGLHNLPERYLGVVGQALLAYRGDTQNEQFDSVALDAFATYIDEHIHKAVAARPVE